MALRGLLGLDGTTCPSSSPATPLNRDLEPHAAIVWCCSLHAWKAQLPCLGDCSIAAPVNWDSNSPSILESSAWTLGLAVPVVLAKGPVARAMEAGAYRRLSRQVFLQPLLAP